MRITLKKRKGHNRGQDNQGGSRDGDDSDSDSDNDSEDDNEEVEIKPDLEAMKSKKHNDNRKGERNDNSNNKNKGNNGDSDSRPMMTNSKLEETKQIDQNDACHGMDMEFEDQDPFDFSASLAKGRELDKTEKKAKNKKGNNDGCDEEEEEEEDEEEEGIEEKKETVKVQISGSLSITGKEKQNKNKKEKSNTDTDDKTKIMNSNSESHSESKILSDSLLKDNNNAIMSKSATLTAVGNKRKKNSDVRNMILRTKKNKLNETTSKSHQSTNENKNDDEDVIVNKEEVEDVDIDDINTGERQPHRCLIFAQHRQTLDIIEKCVLKLHFPSVSYRRLDGTVPPIVRADIARQFNSQDDYTTANKYENENENEIENEKITEESLNLNNMKASRNMKTLKKPSRRNETSNELKTVKGDIRILLMTTRSCGLGLNLVAADTVIL